MVSKTDNKGSSVSVEALLQRTKQMMNDDKTLTNGQKAIMRKALKIATDSPVTVEGKDQAVFFTVSKLPSKENKVKAFAYVDANKKSYMIDHTEAGSRLEDMALFDKVPFDLAYMPWFVVSTRYAAEAKGDVYAEWANAHPQSTSMLIEAPVLLANADVKTINKISKDKFISSIIAERVPETYAYIKREALKLVADKSMAIKAKISSKVR